jgi:hypothetical protein
LLPLLANPPSKAILSFGFSVFHFGTAFAPKEVKSVVEMLGFTSDASKAFQELSVGAEMDGYLSK